MVSFETAKLAATKGLYLDSKYYYDEQGAIIDNWDNVYVNGLTESYYEAPTQSELQRWLREEHKIDVLVSHQFLQEEQTPVIYDVCVTTGIDNTDSERYCNYCFGQTFETYEEAFEFGLQEALKLKQG